MEFRDIAWTIYANLAEFHKSRNIIPSSAPISSDEFNRTMRTTGYVVTEGIAQPRERLPERNSLIIIFSPTSEAARKKGNFTKLLDQLRMLTPAKRYFNNTDIIFISNEKPVSVINGYEEIIESLRAQYKQLHIEAYMYEKLFIMPDNSLIPLHRILSQEEVEKLNADRLTDNTRRTPISTQDPPAVWLGARTGDVIEIKRVSGETGYSAAYRVVK